MTEPEFNAPHLFDPRHEICFQCRRPRLEIEASGPKHCDGMVVWREWLKVDGGFPVWQKEPVMRNTK